MSPISPSTPDRSPDRFPSAEILQKTLDALGKSSEEIAATLLAMGHKGKPECPKTCPVAHFLRTKFPQADFIRVGYGSGFIVGKTCIHLNHGALYDFLTEFDEGKFPFLENES